MNYAWKLSAVATYFPNEKLLSSAEKSAKPR